MMTPELLGRLVDEHAAALTLFARQWCAAPRTSCRRRSSSWPFDGRRRTTPPPGCSRWCATAPSAPAAPTAAADGTRRTRPPADRRGSRRRNPQALDGETATAALEALPLEEREVVIAHLWGGLPFEQIGRLAGVSSSTAHRRYLKALTTLRERLRVPCPNPSTPD